MRSRGPTRSAGGPGRQPVVVDGQLISAVNCSRGGGLRGYDLTDPRRRVEVWQVDLNRSCIESSPTLWRGVIYAGSRDGFFYSFGEPDESPYLGQS